MFMDELEAIDQRINALRCAPTHRRGELADVHYAERADDDAAKESELRRKPLVVVSDRESDYGR